MTLYHEFSVTQTDYFGVDYQSNVSLTLQEAKYRILDGRLLSPQEARARHHALNWEAFKSWPKSTGGRMDTAAWQNREVINQNPEVYG